MNVLITEQIVSEYSYTIAATVEKVSGVVSVNHRDQSLQVLCVNASHRAWRGGGKYFHNAADALAAYRSGEMKAIIQAALDFAKGATK